MAFVVYTAKPLANVNSRSVVAKPRNVATDLDWPVRCYFVPGGRYLLPESLGPNRITTLRGPAAKGTGFALGAGAVPLTGTN